MAAHVNGQDFQVDSLTVTMAGVWTVLAFFEEFKNRNWARPTSSLMEHMYSKYRFIVFYEYMRGLVLLIPDETLNVAATSQILLRRVLFFKHILELLSDDLNFPEEADGRQH